MVQRIGRTFDRKVSYFNPDGRPTIEGLKKFNPVNQPVTYLGAWEQGKQYFDGDMAIDAGWTAIANKGTTDRPAPQPSGPQELSPTTPAFLDQSHLGLVESGHLYDFTAGGWLERVDIWVTTIDPAYEYQVFIIDETDPNAPTFTEITSPIGSEDSWITVFAGQRVVPLGSKLRFLVRAINVSSTTQITGDWSRGGNSNGAPATGNWNRQNNNAAFRVSNTDAVSGDRTLDLAQIIAGSHVRFTNQANAGQWVEYYVDTDGVNAGTHHVWDMTVESTGPQGEPPVGSLTTMDAQVPTPASTLYAEDVGYWTGNQPSFANVEGFLQLGGVPQIGEQNNAFGIRISFQPAYVSPDWDILPFGGFQTGGGPSLAEITSTDTGVVIVIQQAVYDAMEAAGTLDKRRLYLPLSPAEWAQYNS